MFYVVRTNAAVTLVNNDKELTKYINVGQVCTVLALEQKEDAIKVANYFFTSSCRTLGEDKLKQILNQKLDVLNDELRTIDAPILESEKYDTPSNTELLKVDVTKVSEDVTIQKQDVVNTTPVTERDTVKKETKVSVTKTIPAKKKKVVAKKDKVIEEHRYYMDKLVLNTNFEAMVAADLDDTRLAEALEKGIGSDGIKNPLNIKNFVAVKNEDMGDRSVVYVDGSHVINQSRVGIGVTVLHKGVTKSYSFCITHMSKALINIHNIELLALILGTRLGEYVTESRDFVVYSDSLSVLCALYQHGHSIDYGKFNTCVNDFVTEYGNTDTLEYRKIKAHVGVRGNELADYCAKEVSKSSPLAMEMIYRFDKNSKIDFDSFEVSTYLKNLELISREGH